MPEIKCKGWHKTAQMMTLDAKNARSASGGNSQTTPKMVLCSSFGRTLDGLARKLTPPWPKIAPENAKEFSKNLIDYELSLPGNIVIRLIAVFLSANGPMVLIRKPGSQKPTHVT